jgi:hypothetical protein
LILFSAVALGLGTGALAAAARDGATSADVGRALAYAAALRVAHFGTADEHSD